MVTELTSDSGTMSRMRNVYLETKKLRLPWLALVIIAVLLICAAFSELLAPHDPTDINILDAKLAPFENWDYPLGTDILGRDMLSRLIFGARTSVVISMTALIAGAAAGTALGLASGYRGGWIDALIMRVCDGAFAFPTILIALIFVIFWGTGVQNIIFAVVIGVWSGYARMIRGEVLGIKEMDFVTIARMTGVSPPVIVIRHIFPNVVNLLVVIMSMSVPGVILLEAGLSFLGLGLPPGAPGWGIMVNEGRAVILDVWWLSVLPGVAITVVVMAFNFLGDWLRDALDPRQHRIGI